MEATQAKRAERPTSRQHGGAGLPALNRPGAHPDQNAGADHAAACGHATNRGNHRVDFASCRDTASRRTTCR